MPFSPFIQHTSLQSIHVSLPIVVAPALPILVREHVICVKEVLWYPCILTTHTHHVTSHMSCPIDDPAGIFGESYNQCLEQIKQQYVTATAIGSMVACLLMGLVANLPIALAPGMGMNAYFVSSLL